MRGWIERGFARKHGIQLCTLFLTLLRADNIQLFFRNRLRSVCGPGWQFVRWAWSTIRAVNAILSVKELGLFPGMVYLLVAVVFQPVIGSFGPKMGLVYVFGQYMYYCFAVALYPWQKTLVESKERGPTLHHLFRLC